MPVWLPRSPQSSFADDHNVSADTTEVALEVVSSTLLNQNNSLSIATLPKYPANIERACW